jgi:hypothetical protein
VGCQVGFNIEKMEKNGWIDKIDDDLNIKLIHIYLTKNLMKK